MPIIVGENSLYRVVDNDISPWNLGDRYTNITHIVLYRNVRGYSYSSDQSSETTRTAQSKISLPFMNPIIDRINKSNQYIFEIQIDHLETWMEILLKILLFLWKFIVARAREFLIDSNISYWLENPINTNRLKSFGESPNRWLLFMFGSACFLSPLHDLHDNEIQLIDLSSLSEWKRNRDI